MVYLTAKKLERGAWMGGRKAKLDRAYEIYLGKFAKYDKSDWSLLLRKCSNYKSQEINI